MNKKSKYFKIIIDEKGVATDTDAADFDETIKIIAAYLAGVAIQNKRMSPAEPERLLQGFMHDIYGHAHKFIS